MANVKQVTYFNLMGKVLRVYISLKEGDEVNDLQMRELSGDFIGLATALGSKSCSPDSSVGLFASAMLEYFTATAQKQPIPDMMSKFSAILLKRAEEMDNGIYFN